MGESAKVRFLQRRRVADSEEFGEPEECQSGQEGGTVMGINFLGGRIIIVIMSVPITSALSERQTDRV